MTLRAMLEFAAAIVNDDRSTIEELALISGKSKSYISEARRLYRNLAPQVTSKVLAGETPLSVGFGVALSRLTHETQLKQLPLFEARSKPAQRKQPLNGSVDARITYLRKNPRVIAPSALSIVNEVLDFLEGKKTTSLVINSSFGQEE